MDIKDIRERVRTGNYLVKSHAVQHALKQGFERKTNHSGKTLHSDGASEKEYSL